ncbi:MAG: radical SAM/SPASM domain-containing protein [Anaerolineae bacterium]
MDIEAARKSPKAYLNLLWILLQRKQGFRKVYGYPFLLTLDPSSVCQLHCPFCPTGLREGHRARTLMSLEFFKRIMDELGLYLFRLDLYNWGEPLLNKHFVDMVRYAKQSNIWVCTSTNLSLGLSDHQVEDLVTSGLDKLIISLDGVTEEKYLKYRFDGNFELVMENMRAIVRKKRELGLNRPAVVWQFLVFRHNEEDIETAKRMAAEIGVELYLAAPFVKQEEPWKEMTPTLEEFNLYSGRAQEGTKKVVAPTLDAKPKRCDWLYASAAINANGSVSPCCAIWEEKDDFGNLQGGDFKKLYNKMYQFARDSFLRRTKSEIDIICNRCPVEGQQMMLLPHLPQIIKAANPGMYRILRRIKEIIY